MFSPCNYKDRHLRPTYLWALTFWFSLSTFTYNSMIPPFLINILPLLLVFAIKLPEISCG